MIKQTLLTLVAVVVLIPSARANPSSRRAVITGAGGDGRCTIEVSVDHAAEVEISGDLGVLTTTGGQPATWQRFQCNAPLPRKPVDFRFAGINGRGSMRLIQDPRATSGRAVVQINDPRGGRGNYAFELRWRPAGGPGWQPGPPPPPPGRGPDHGGSPTARSIRVCQDSVTDRLNRQGYTYVAFDRTIPGENNGRSQWISGAATGKRQYRATGFSFSCSVDLRFGTIRSVDVRPR